MKTWDWTDCTLVLNDASRSYLGSRRTNKGHVNEDDIAAAHGALP